MLACRPPSAACSLEVDVASGSSGGLVLGLGQRLFELTLEQPGLDLFFFRALAEVSLTTCGLLLKQDVGLLEGRRPGTLLRRLVRNHLAELRVDFQSRTAARADDLDVCTSLQAHQRNPRLEPRG